MGFLSGFAGAIGGSLISGLFNKGEAEDNRAFQEKMSSTSHQREVEDLKAAGLNPLLSAKYGGASTPSGAQATMPDLGATVTSALALKKVKSEIDKNNASVRLTDAQSKIADEQYKQASAISVKENIDAIRKQREFNQFEGRDGSAVQIVTPYLESLPPSVRGPLRTAFGGIDRAFDGGEDFYRHLKHLVSSALKGREANSAKGARSDADLIQALKDLDKLPESRYDKYKVPRKKEPVKRGSKLDDYKKRWMYGGFSPY